MVFEKYFSNNLDWLAALQDDKLVETNPDGIKITETGRLFLRNIAMCFDRYLNASKAGQSFSKTV